MNATSEMREKILDRLSIFLSRESREIATEGKTCSDFINGLAEGLYIAGIISIHEVVSFIYHSENEVVALAHKRRHGLSKKTVRAILEKRLKEAENSET